MKKIYKLSGLVICLCAIMPIRVEAGIFATGARQAGMGRTSTSLTDFWSCHNNQAGVALIQKISIGLHYEHRFYLNELSYRALGLLFPMDIGVLGLTFSHYGYSLFNQSRLGILYARAFGPYFRIGLQLDLLRTSLGDNYGNKNNFTFELGIQSDITKTLTIGAWVFNPFQAVLSQKTNDRIPAVFRLGLKWSPSEYLLICTEFEKSSLQSPLLLRAGIEYCLKNKFSFRCGTTSRQEFFTMGFGLKTKHLQLDLSAVMHQTLGFSQQASLVFNF